MEKTANQIITVARQWLHVREIGNNLGFNDPLFEQRLRAVGWRPPYAWCGFYVKSIYKEVYGHLEIWEDLYQDTLSGGVLAMWRNAKYKGLPTSDAPVLGGIACWETAGGRGHTGIPTRIIDDFHFWDIEGNTNSVGSREGDCVLEKRRHTNARFKRGAPKGWRYLGCIHPHILKDEEILPLKTNPGVSDDDLTGNAQPSSN